MNLKSQRVDKVIINVPLETEQAQKIAALKTTSILV